MSKEIKNKVVPKLRFPEFKDSGEWKEKKLGECLLQHPDYGVNAPGVPFSNNLPTYLRITDISEEGNFLKNQRVSVGKDVTQANYLEEGDIVFARTGASVGKSYKYRIEDGELVFAGFLIRVKPHKNKINSELLFQYLSTDQYWRWVKFSSARSGQPGINGNEYASMPIPLPTSLTEQQKIASCLSSLDDLITAQSEKLEALKEHKKGLMQQLFPAEGETVPKLRFPEFKDSEEWEVKELNELCKFTRGPFGGALKKEIFVTDGYAVYEQSHAIYSNFNSFRYYITEDKFNELRRFEIYPGDIIMSCSGTMGKFSIVPQESKKGVINQALLKLTVKKDYDIEFMKATLELPITQNKLLSQSAGGAIKNVVEVAQIKEIKLFMPRLKEQLKIASCLSSLDDLITSQTEKIEVLKEHKKGLMQGLFPGTV